MFIAIGWTSVNPDHPGFFDPGDSEEASLVSLLHIYPVQGEAEVKYFEWLIDLGTDDYYWPVSIDILEMNYQQASSF